MRRFNDENKCDQHCYVLKVLGRLVFILFALANQISSVFDLSNLMFIIFDENEYGLRP